MSKMSIKDFLKYFPKVKPPVTLTEDSNRVFSKKNKPFSIEATEEYLVKFEKEIDEFTEFIPCFRIIQIDNIHIIVYWKGGLMTYEYIMATLNKKGELISRKIIAGTKSNGETVVQSAATIDEDLIIHIMVGATNKGKDYDPKDSKPMSMEVLPTGDIVFTIEKALEN